MNPTRSKQNTIEAYMRVYNAASDDIGKYFEDAVNGRANFADLLAATRQKLAAFEASKAVIKMDSAATKRVLDEIR